MVDSEKLITPTLAIHPLELKLALVCNACGCIVEGSWMSREEAPREIIIAVDKCGCDSPLLKD